MINIEKTVTPSPEQWEIIIEGMRNPKNSWDRMDSVFCIDELNCELDGCPYAERCEDLEWEDVKYGFNLGDNDLTLAENLDEGGSEHSKYRRMAQVIFTVSAPLYFWKEFDTYKVGTVSNSCSTMHKIHSKEFRVDDFSYEHLDEHSTVSLYRTISDLNENREKFLETKDKNYWWQMIQLLPTSYNQKRTISLNYEVLATIYRQRKNHKLDEWHQFCDWIKTLPYADELITGEE